MSSFAAEAHANVRKPAAPVLGPGDFATFFRDVHGHDPFPWQERLTLEVLDQGTWPTVIDLPTGTGKTAVLDTAVFAMAVKPDVTPRRVVFVIDRRIVVDQVCDRARRLQRRIEAGDTATLRRVRDCLRALSDGESLGVAALRGGIPIDDGWADRPDQPWVIVSTVDQFGSRLLFRGYGVSPGMRPIHAGLAGNDCLVILDEVHLSVPFAQTVTHLAASPRGQLPRRFAVVEMSATPSNDSARRFTLDPAADLANCPELCRRVTAAKQATLLGPVRSEDAIPAAVLKIVHKVGRSTSEHRPRVHSIGVIVNRVRTAREVHRVLMAAGLSAHLITGRMRPLDRVDALERIGPIVDPNGREPGDSLEIVVATQAIEVGADFSFELLITECAPVDCLRQRFGRLDRRGTYAARTERAAQAWIVGVKSVVASKKPDPIYGDAVKVTWEELQRRAQQRRLDVSPLALTGFAESANAPRPSAPLLLSTYLDVWVQTNPDPIVQPSVEWFLHGMNQERPADVSIVWRRDRSAETLRLVPPRQAEALQAPIGAVRSWLSGSAEVDVADVAQEDESRGPASAIPAFAGKWVRWEGSAEGINEGVDLDDIRPGDLLVIDPELGGLSAETWDPGSSESVSDLGDAAQLAYGRRVTLRLDPELPYMDSAPTPAQEASADQPTPDRIKEWLGTLASKPVVSDWIRQILERLRTGFEATPVRLDEDTAAYYVLTERHPSTNKPLSDPGTMDGGDEAGSLTGTATPLRDHLAGVGDRAGKIARRLCLPVAIQHDLSLAGSLHDIGKVDQRFQLQLVGGDRIALEMLEEPLAKSLRGSGHVRRYPSGMRHELASLAMIESNQAVLSGAHDKDLVLHLISSHHGWARPLPPIIEDNDPQTLSFALGGCSMTAGSDLTNTSLAVDVADRFWRLVACYGYHGLAWLEAILRLADHQQSAQESER